MASLTVKGLEKRFGGKQALRGVDLEVAHGEFCVLLGPSGCGKSTLLNIVAGLITQDAGTVAMEGRPVDRLTPRERDVAVVFQSYALYPHMTVEGNLSFPLRMQGMEKGAARRRVEETARLLGIGDLLGRKPRELSGGQQQRVAMGRALVRRPSLFLLDEPLSNLDARLRANVRIELKRLHREIRGTVLYVTHDQVEAMTLGDRVVVMRDGRMLQAGTPSEIYSRPADRFVAGFIGSPEMNFFRGRLIRDGHARVFEGRGFRVDLGPLPCEEPGDGAEVELGVRPEDLEPGPGSGQEAGVEMVTHTGAEKFLHARVGEEPITVRAPKDFPLSPGDTVSLVFHPGRLHLFHQDVRIGP